MFRLNLFSRAVLIGVGLLALAAPSSQAGDVRWRHDYGRAMREARRTGRPVLVTVGTHNCMWCRRMEASTFSDPDVAQLLADRFISVKVDAEQNGDLARELGVRSYPTLFLASASGEILEVQEGFVAASRFLGQLQRALNEADSEEQ